MLIFAKDPQPYQGADWLTFLEPAPDVQGYERRVLFESGLGVDFIPLPVAYLEQWLLQGRWGRRPHRAVGAGVLTVPLGPVSSPRR